MQIIRCDSSHDAMWNEFVRASPRASFYHRAEWRAINQRWLGHPSAYLGAVDDGRMIGVLPIVHLKTLLFGNLACSMPFVNYGGPCGDSDEVESQLMDVAAAVADEWGVDYLELRSQRHLGPQYPSSDHKVSMTIALAPDPETLMAAFKRDQRAEIRKAAKNGFVTKFGPELIEDFYSVLSASWRELGTPIFSFGYLRAVVAAFPKDIRICVVYDAQGVPAAGAFDGIHNGTVEGMWLGMRSEYRRQLVGYVLYWELIKHACESGWRMFHLGRSSKDSGGEQFKKKWNAETLQLYWTYILRTRQEMPSLNPDNPKFQLAIRIWQQLPLSVTEMIGPHIARGIP